MVRRGVVEGPRSTRRRGSRVGLVLVVVLVSWLAAGVLRAEAGAHDYFARAHGAGGTIIGVEIHAVVPAIPPFWAVNISGEVMEAGAIGPGYISAMWLWVEPLTGWVIVLAAG